MQGQQHIKRGFYIIDAYSVNTYLIDLGGMRWSLSLLIPVRKVITKYLVPAIETRLVLAGVK